jgi:phage FluMu protein Com
MEATPDVVADKGKTTLKCHSCGKGFTASKFAPKSTKCPDCKNPKAQTISADVVGETDTGEIDTDPFSIIEAYQLFGKDAAYVYLLLNGFTLTADNILHKTYEDNVTCIATFAAYQFVLTDLSVEDSGSVGISTPEEIDELPDAVIADLAPIVHLVWTRRNT